MFQRADIAPNIANRVLFSYGKQALQILCDYTTICLRMLPSSAKKKILSKDALILEHRKQIAHE